ncbi:MAG TPA: ABC transporter permease [Terriglobales bacterium]|nr:ABC transporter permease [Terriglobales bacterium]
MLQDLLYALRGMRRQPGLTSVIVLTLGLAIGANTAIFSLMDALLLQALPVKSPQTLMLLHWTANHRPQYHSSSSYGDCQTKFSDQSPSSCSFSKPFLDQLRQQTQTLAAVTASGGNAVFNMSGHGQASIARDQAVAGNYFSVLGVKPALGRLFTPADDIPGAPLVTVLSYRDWQTAFGGEPSAVGATIELNNLPVTIVGVADAQFNGLAPGSAFDGWVPLSSLPQLTPRWNPKRLDADSIWLVIFARLRPGVGVAQAQAETNGLWRTTLLTGAKPLSKPGDNPQLTLVSAQTGMNGIRGRFSQPLTVLMWAVGVILLIACANVAGLLLGRASARQKEFALRRALGARGGRILRQLLTESVTLALIGGVVGLGLAWWGARVLVALMSDGGTTLALHVALDGRVLLFTLAATLATGVLFGLAPGLRGARTDLASSLKDGVGNTRTRRRFRGVHLGNGLVVAQIALCVVVLAAAGLLVRTLSNLRAVNPGFDTANLLLFNVEPALIGYKGARVQALYQRLQDGIAALPGVRGVSYSDNPLVSGSLSETSFHLHGQKSDPDSDTDILSVGVGFFSALHMPLLLGRDFTPGDFVPVPDAPGAKPSGVPLAAVVNETFVRRYLGSTNPIGRVVGGGTGDDAGEYWRIIGVVADAKYQNLRSAIDPTVYVPSENGYASFEVRTAGDPMTLLPAVRGVVRGIDPNLPVFHPQTQLQVIDSLLTNERLLAKLASTFGLLALLLACIGLYALLAQEVTRRTREIGIRMALGAERGRLLRMVMSLGLALAACGIVVGMAGAWALTRYLGNLLFGVKPLDPASLAAVAVILIAVALAACWVPARRATRVDPLVALRCE